MRALFISALSLSLFIGIWWMFYDYSNQTLQQMIEECEEEIMPEIESENWNNAYTHFTSLHHEWREYQDRALYMLNSDSLQQVNQGFAKTIMYIKAKDESNSSGELLALKEALLMLHQNEAVTLNNIF